MPMILPLIAGGASSETYKGTPAAQAPTPYLSQCQQQFSTHHADKRRANSLQPSKRHLGSYQGVMQELTQE